jgi:AcrR family transcriptional regulator
MGRTPKITDEQILAAARQVFLDQGYGASTADIAEKAGISEASIFKRFPTKQDLFMAALGINKVPGWVKKLESASPSADFKAELTEICQEMVAFYQDVMPRILMLISPLNLIRVRKFVPPPLRDTRLLTLFLERAIAQGLIRPCDAQTLAYMIVGSINNYVMTQDFSAKLRAISDLPTVLPMASEDFIAHLVEMLWWSIAPEPD